MKLLGITNDFDTCECCGRTGLKKVMVIGDESGQMNYGVNCGAKKLGLSGLSRTRSISRAQAAVNYRGLKEYVDRRAGQIAALTIWESVLNSLRKLNLDDIEETAARFYFDGWKPGRKIPDKFRCGGKR